MNDRSSLKTDKSNNKRKAEDTVQVSMNGSNGSHNGVEVKKEKRIPQEEVDQLVREIESISISDGMTCYMIPSDWWLSLKNCNVSSDINLQISARSLYLNGVLKKDLVIDRDFRLIPEEIFFKLRDTFGIADDYEIPVQHVIKTEDSENEPTVFPLIHDEIEALIRKAETEKLIPGDKWYIVARNWWNEVYKAKNSGYTEDIPAINCAKITRWSDGGWVLLPHLSETSDYYFIPEKVFERFKETRGIDNPERDIHERTVISRRKKTFLQTYLRYVTVFLARDHNAAKILPISGEETMNELRANVIDLMGLNRVVANRIRFYITPEGGEEHWEYIDPDQNNIDVYFDTPQKVAVDIKDERGNWFFTSTRAQPPQPVYSGKALTPCPTKQNDVDIAVPGTCGLHNLGNTCFMASAIQCISNIRAVTNYFLTNEFTNDLNITNPLGTQGELAQAYAELIQQMWTNTMTAVSPRRIKAIIGEFAPRFSGYSQQDSQELLAFLLDGIHEDLNRIKNKPYLQHDEDADNLEEHEAAQIAWANYKARNDSIIVDKCHGQLKSRLTCPSCHKISIKFDPFCFLSVPVPARKNTPKITLVLIYNQVPKKKWAKFSMNLAAGYCTVRDVLNCVSNNLKTFNLKISCCLFNCGYHSDCVQILKDDDFIVSDDIPKQYYIAQVDHFEENRKYIIVKNHSQQGRMLSIPMLFSYLDISEITQEFIEKKVIPFIQATYHIEGTVLEEDSYSIFVDAGEKQLLFTTDLREPRQGYVTLIIVWKNPNIFNHYRGEHLIDREVSVFQGKDITLRDCIDLFTREEQLGEHDSWYCPRCKEHKRAMKKLDLWSLPETLFIHLKRFHYSRFNREKIDEPVLIPVSNFELNDKLANERHEHVTYELIACSNHKGGLGGGHYTTCASNHKNKRWYEFNDAYVTAVYPPADPWFDPNAYVLVYQRKAVIPDAAYTDTNLEMETE